MFTLNVTGWVISIGAFFSPLYPFNHFPLFRVRYICRIDLRSYPADKRKEMEQSKLFTRETTIFSSILLRQRFIWYPSYWLIGQVSKGESLKITLVISFFPFVLLIEYTPGCFTVVFVYIKASRWGPNSSNLLWYSTLLYTLKTLFRLLLNCSGTGVNGNP